MPPSYPHLQHSPMKIHANLGTLQMLLSVINEATNYVTKPNWSLQNVYNNLRVEKQFRSSGMWLCIAGCAVPSVSKECSPFTFEGEAVLALLDPEDEGTISFLSKHQEPFIQQHCVTSHRFQFSATSTLTTVERLLHWRPHIFRTCFVQFQTLWCCWLSSLMLQLARRGCCQAYPEMARQSYTFSKNIYSTGEYINSLSHCRWFWNGCNTLCGAGKVPPLLPACIFIAAPTPASSLVTPKFQWSSCSFTQTPIYVCWHL
jgi:hypothetical protein